MLSISQAILSEIVLHSVGNKSKDEPLLISKEKLQLAEPVKELLAKYFISPFKNVAFSTFSHTSELDLNEIYAFSKKIFADPDSIFLYSISISKHLYEQSTHPNIKAGELYIVYLSGCVVDDEEVDAIGIFKSENKETFLKVLPINGSYEINAESGVNINKLDKGCLIFNTEKEKGYKVCVIDQTNKGEEARYWKDDFLQVDARKDSFHYTQNYMDLCKKFVTEKLPNEFEVSKTDQIDLLNRSVNFFKNKDQFDLNEFNAEVMQQPEIIETFKDFKKTYATEREIPIVDEFEISDQAVKKQAKIFKSVLKLDKNFHIYIHGDKDLIEKGVDQANGMKYYKIFYKEES